MIDEPVPLTDDEIVTLIASQVEQAMNREDGQLSQRREESLNRYRGRPDGKEQDGRSKIVTREVMESIEWALPSLVRPFVSGNAVEFEALNAEDEEQAELETAIINYELMTRNGGAQKFYLWGKDTLMNPAGYIKVHRRTRIRRTMVEFENLSPEDFASLEANPEHRIVAAQINEVGLYDVESERTFEEAYNVWEPTPGEEVLVDQHCTSWDLDRDAQFICHRYKESYTSLVLRGFDPGLLEENNGALIDDVETDSEAVNRRDTVDENPLDHHQDDESLRRFEVHEWYGWIDTDGDGIAEYRQIILAGKSILLNEEVDYQPFVCMQAIAMPHQHGGYTFDDLVRDLQHYSTQLRRALLNNAHDINDPKLYVGRDALSKRSKTLQYLRDPRQRLVPTDNPTAIVPQAHQPIIQETLMAIQDMDSMNQRRTGVAPQLSMDPNILKQATEGAYLAAEAAATQRLEQIVRNWASTSVARLGVKMHALCRAYPDADVQRKIGGQWVSVDPGNWPERPAMKEKAGLGFNNTQSEIALLQGMLGLQEKLAGQRMAGPQHIFHTVKRIVSAANLGHAESFMFRPEEIPPAQPDPMNEAALANLQSDTQYKQAQAAEKQVAAMQKQVELESENARLRAELAELMAKIENLGAGTVLKYEQADALRAGNDG